METRSPIRKPYWYVAVAVISLLLVLLVVGDWVSDAELRIGPWPPELAYKAYAQEPTPRPLPYPVFLPLVLKSECAEEEPAAPQVSVLVSSPDEIVLEARVPPPQLNQVTVDDVTYQRLYLPEAGTTTEIGKPELPTFGRFIAVPMGAKLQIEILEEMPSVAALGEQGMYHVFPAQQPQTDQGQEPPFGFNASFYQQDVFYPPKTVTVDEVTTLRGTNVTVVRFFPVQFNPVQGQLRVYSRLRVRISFSGGSGQFVDRRLWSPYFESMYQQLLLNYPLLKAEGEAGMELADYPAIASERGAEFLIITPPSLLEQANILADWKRRKGIDTEVRTTLQTGTTASQIRDYILTAYNDWDPVPSFVLLFGDAEAIPTYYVTVHPWSCSDCWYPSGTRIGTDLYYADMTGNYYPELAIARIPVDTSAEAAIVVNKIINYERTPPTSPGFYTHALVAAYFEDNDHDHYDERRYVKTSEEMRDFLLAQGYSADRVYFTPQEVIPTNYNNGLYGNGEPLPAELLKPGFAWDGWTAAVRSAVNSGRFLVMHRDHGTSANNGHSTVEGWLYPRWTASDVSALTNGSQLPVVFSVNCETGWFDGETDFNGGQNTQSLAEALLLHSGGAVGVVGATRISFSGYNDFMSRGFLDAIWPEFIPEWGSGAPEYRLGNVLNIGKLSMATFWGDPEGYQLVQFEIFHYFGDPTMEIWTALPGSLSVSHPTASSPGATSLTVSVDQDDALVSLVKDNQIIARAVSSGGSATLNFEPVGAGLIYVTVTKHNYVPYNGSVEVVDPFATSTSTPTPTSTPEAPVGLEGYWQLDEAGGQRMDSSGRGNHLTDRNTVGSLAGQIGLAADFESDRWEYLSIGDTAQVGLDITGSLTLVGWMNAEQVARWQMMASKYEWDVANRGYRFGVDSSSRLHFVASLDGQYLDGYILTGDTVLGAGVWHHVAAVFDAGARRMSVYLDGELDGTRTVAFSSMYHSTAPFMLGANMQNGTVVQHFDGQLDEWRVYSQALSQGEIQALMSPSAPTSTPTATRTPTATATSTATGTPGPTATPTATSTSIASPTPSVTATPTEEPSAGLLGSWALDETSGGRMDSSGLGNHLTDYNTVGSVLGQVGLAADFESDQREYLSISDGAQNRLDVAGSLTLVGWMNPEQVERWQVLAGKYEYGLNGRAYRLDLRPGNGIGFIVSPDGTFASGYLLEAHPSYTMRPGAWYHVAGVFDAAAGNMVVYVDGELVASRTVTFDRVYDTTAPFMLGADMQNGNAVQHFDGQLDEWRMYDRALTQAEIQSLMLP